MARSEPEVTQTTAVWPAHHPSGVGRMFSWRRSLQGKVAAFMLLGCLLAYSLGAAIGVVMLERSLREQWARQASMNAQIASASIRRIYSAVMVDVDGEGQVRRIVAGQPLGDSASVLDTGFSPGDVLALAATQTRKNIWLFRAMDGGAQVQAVADAWGTGTEATMRVGRARSLPQQVFDQPYVGFANIGGVEYFVGTLPVIQPSGELSGVVASSIGTWDELYGSLYALIRGTLLTLLAVLFIAGCVVVMLMRRVLRPVPELIGAITRIARGDTATPTPCRERPDEIGDLAEAVEKLRHAVIERECLLEIKATALRLEHMAHHDALTGLPNRALLGQSLAAACTTLGRGDQRINCLMFDLDRFKAVNDRFGHATGDALLEVVAQRVMLLLGPDDMAARLGGDEFAIIQKVARDGVYEGTLLAERLVAALERPFDIGGVEVCIGTSVGIARAPGDGRTPHELLSYADLALYTAKRQGDQGPHFCFYVPGMTMNSVLGWTGKAGPPPAHERPGDGA